jgi:hypothetical protein
LQIFSGIIIVRKGQGAPSENHRKILVEATEGCNFNRGKSADRGKVHKIRKTNFVDLHNDGRNFQKLMKISPKRCARNPGIVRFVNLPSSFHAKRQGGGG